MNGEHFSDTRQNAGKDAISNFLVSLSDQQLVTGLAILIAAVSGQESLSTYDFYIALSLGWFSCTTHLATINVLCVRFKRHPYIREVRVAGLMCAIALLSYAFVDAISVRDLTIPLHCPNNAGDGVELFGISTIVFLSPIWFDYLTAVQTLYLGSFSLWDIIDEAVLKVKGQKLRPLRKLRDLKAQEKTERVEEIVLKSNRFVQARLGLLFYEGSFLATLPGITYSFCFGVAQIVGLRWRRPLELSDESTEMGFGQITALLLLILPFMSIGEAFICEYLLYPLDFRKDIRICQPSRADSLSAYRENRRSPASMYEAVSIADTSAEENHELVADPQHDARSQTAGSTAGPDSPRHQQNEYSQYCKNIKGIEKYFPLELRALPPLGQRTESINVRVSLLRRYMLVKSAEETLSMGIALTIFALHVCLGIIAASFMNTAEDRLLRVGILLILILVVLRFYDFPFRILALVIKFCRTQV